MSATTLGSSLSPRGRLTPADAANRAQRSQDGHRAEHYQPLRSRRCVPEHEESRLRDGDLWQDPQRAADWLCSPDNHSEPFDHVETECSPCGGYYRTGADQWVSKDRHDSPHVFETLQPGDPFSNYSEAQYGNRTIRWLKRMTEEEPTTPWFAFIGTSGPHLGVVPAPWHRARTASFEINGSLAHAPRTPNFNQHAPDHHPLLATQPALDARALEVIDMHFRDRLGTLLVSAPVPLVSFRRLKRSCGSRSTIWWRGWLRRSTSSSSRSGRTLRLPAIT